MIGRRAAVGLSLLCALMFSALVVQSAAAQKGTKAVNTTAVTCVKVSVVKTGDFDDAHCDVLHKNEKGVITKEGEYTHEAISNDVTTEIEVTNEKTKDKITKVEEKEVIDPTMDSTPSVLKGVLGGVKTEIECQKAASTKNKEGKSLSFIHNVLVEKKHTVTGTVQVEFSGCEVKKPSNCKIKEPILTTATFEGVEELNEETKNEMGVEFKGEGTEGAFAELIFENITPEPKCALLNGGKAFLVLGSAIATGKAPTQKEKYSGATAVYEPGAGKNKMQTLEIGKNKEQEFFATFTTRMAGGGSPISLTTVT